MTNPPKSAPKRTAGFTLLELMVVLVVVGIMLGMVAFNGLQNDQQVVQKDAQRVALLLQLAREEAIVRNAQVAFELDAEKYRFYVKENKEWKLLDDNDMFRERSFERGPLGVSLQPNPNQNALPLKIIFGREPVENPFTLTLTYGNTSVSIIADGIGHFDVR